MKASLFLIPLLLVAGVSAWEPFSLRRRALTSEETTITTSPVETLYSLAQFPASTTALLWPVPPATPLGALSSVGRALFDDDDDDDDGYVRRRPRRPRGKKSKKSKSKKSKKSKSKKSKRRPTRDSSSVTRLRGVLRIVVIGNGEMCFIKIFQRGMSYTQQFGRTTSTSAFINLYGHGECERTHTHECVVAEGSVLAGAVGVAYGVVRAGVMAEAHRRGDVCETKVVSFVIAKTKDLDPNDGVSVMVGGAAGGEALAVCP